MNRRFLTILLSAFLVAAGASYLVYRVAGNRLRAGAHTPTSGIVVAARNLEIGTLIRESDLKTGQWVGALPTGTIAKTEALVGRGVVSTLYEGEPIMESRLAPPGSGGGLAATIRQGMRACAVRVNEVVGVAGFVAPGMRVDVLIAGIVPGVPTTEGPKVKTLLQNIEVLSAGTNIQKDNEGKPAQVQVVNLLVTPEQAEVLSLASNETRIQLVLRNPLDTQIATPPGTVMAALFADHNAPAPMKARAAPLQRASVSAPRIEKPPAPQIYLVEVLNGSKRTEEKFATAEGKQ
jgi:pilus assembly protein CpaB